MVSPVLSVQSSVICLVRGWRKWLYSQIRIPRGGGNLTSEETENGFGVRLTKDTKGNWQIEQGHSINYILANVESLQDGQYLFHKSSSPYNEYPPDITYFKDGDNLVNYGTTISPNRISWGFDSESAVDGYNFSLTAELGSDSTDGVSISYGYASEGNINFNYARIKLLTGTDNKPYISFQDQTINNGAEVKLSEFALKSELSNIDLTNYQGDWKLSNPKTPNTTSTGNNYGATNVSIETIDLATDVESEHRPQAILIRSCQSSQPETTPIHDSGIHVNYAGTSLYQVINDGSIFDVSSNTYTGYVQRTYPGVMTYEEYEAGQTPEVIASIRMDLIGIRIKDTTIQEDEFTLKSLVDRIAALETQVSELQTQLAAKANTTNPTFTGKVTINSITE